MTALELIASVVVVLCATLFLWFGVYSAICAYEMLCEIHHKVCGDEEDEK